MGLKNFVELRNEQQQELELISQKIEALEKQIDGYDRKSGKIKEQQARLRELERMYIWRGQVMGAMEVNGRFGKETNGNKLVFEPDEVYEQIRRNELEERELRQGEIDSRR